MSYDGWMTYNGVEVINLSRTAQLADALGLTSVATRSSDVAWIQTALAGASYSAPSAAPWYDAGYSASGEFAGLVPISVQGLDDSSYSSSGIEYVGDGGNAGKGRRTTLPVVFNVALVGVTEKAVRYGLSWLNQVITTTSASTFCAGADLRYFNHQDGTTFKHRRDVKMTRGTVVTRKWHGDGSVVWWVTFTMTAGDPYEYGETTPVLAGLGGATPTGTSVLGSGEFNLNYAECPVYDYSPIFDPLYPALSPAPTAPNFYPDGWNISAGMLMHRYWARIGVPAPARVNKVPIISLTTLVEARRVKVSIWDHTSPLEDQCDPLFSCVVNYLPVGTTFYVDGHQSAAYMWNGVSPNVRRSDSLVYATDARPVDWTSFADPTNLLVTMDLFANVAATTTGFEGDGQVRMALALVNKTE